MRTMNRQQLDKPISDHFMYEATDDIEGVLRTFTHGAEQELVGGPDGPVRGKAALVASTRACSQISTESVSAGDAPLWGGFRH
jgi:hypothetical protein